MGKPNINETIKKAKNSIKDAEELISVIESKITDSEDITEEELNYIELINSNENLHKGNQLLLRFSASPDKSR